MLSLTAAAAAHTGEAEGSLDTYKVVMHLKLMASKALHALSVMTNAAYTTT